MFVGALRDRPLDEASGRLVRQIQNSVGTLDGLFAAILDISRRKVPRLTLRLPLLDRTSGHHRGSGSRRPCPENCARAISEAFVASQIRYGFQETKTIHFGIRCRRQ